MKKYAFRRIRSSDEMFFREEVSKFLEEINSKNFQIENIYENSIYYEDGTIESVMDIVFSIEKKKAIENVYITQILATYEGSCRDFVDIEIKDGLIREIPFFDTNGEIINYSEALRIYDDGLDKDIWKSRKYLGFIESYINKNNLEIEEI